VYQSIYRKYRPQTFDQVYGQDAISQTLKNAIIYDRVAHAYLFSGPRGTGKTSTAKLLAKAINCTDLVDGQICDKCESCQLIKNGNHPDVIEIDAASNNGVNEVRELIEQVKYMPIKAKKKVYIIDEVHMMTKEAFNALLKTLEEPPDHICFILATTEFHKVLATIKSRCQKFTFKKIQSPDIIKCMQDILDKEEATYDLEALETIASISDGGMRDALSTLEQVMIFTNNNITLEATYEVLDLVSRDNLIKLYDLIYSKQLNEALAFVNELNKEAFDVTQVLEGLIDLAVLDILEDDKDKTYLLNMIDKLDESKTKLERDRDRKLYLDVAIIKSISFGNKPNFSQIMQPSIEKVVEAPKVVEQEKPSNTKTNYERIVSSISINEQPTNPQSESIFSEDEIWNVLVQASRDEKELVEKQFESINDYLLREDTMHAAGLLEEVKVGAVCRNAIIVITNNMPSAVLINDVSNVDAIKELTEKLLGNQRYVFALTQGQWEPFRKNYMAKMKQGTLPSPRPVLDGFVFKTKEEPVEQDDMLVFAKEVFKNKLTIKE